MGVEVVGLETIHDRSALGDGSAPELQEGDAGGGVFVRREDFAPGWGVVAGDFGHVAAHAEQQRVKRVATGGEQRAAAGVFARVPAELAVPRSDPMVIV